MASSDEALYAARRAAERLDKMLRLEWAKAGSQSETRVVHTVSGTPDLMGAIMALTKSEVLVGIPKEKAARGGEPVNNAQLAYIHEFGSPANNIPARPFIHPGIRKAKQQIIGLMRSGAESAIRNQDRQAATTILEKVGMVARNAVVREITNPSPPFAPLQPSTIRARLRKTAGGRRKLRDLKKRGTDLYAWGAAGNIKPLIDTAQLRAAITYVVRKTS